MKLYKFIKSIKFGLFDFCFTRGNTTNPYTVMSNDKQTEIPTSSCDITDAIAMNEAVKREGQVTDGEKHLQFIIGPASFAAVPQGVVSFGARVFGRAAGKLAAGANWKDAAANAATESFNEVLNAFGRNTGADRILDVPKPPSTGGGGSSNTNLDSPSYRDGGVRLSDDPKPTRVRLNTGIKSNTYSPIYGNSVAGYFSPLHLSLGKIMIPSGNQKTKTFFDNILVSVLRNQLQQAVSFNIDPNGTVFTASNIRSYLNEVITALSYYYFMSSVIAYCENYESRNDGMRWIRSQMKADDMNNMVYIKMLLGGMPIPPNLMEYLMYLHQSFMGSDIPGSSIIKVCPFTLNTDGTMNFTALNTSITNLNSDSIRNLAQLLAKACPRWVVGNEQFLSPSAEPLYCDNFKTIFCNLPYQFNNGTTTYRGPSGSNYTDEFKYTSWTNNLDGGAYSMFTAWNTTDAEWSPSFWYPLAWVKSGGGYTNRVAYYNIGGYWYDTFDGYSQNIQRAETYSANQWVTGITWITTPLGAQRCDSVSMNSVTETCYSVLTWLLSLDSIGRIKDTREYKKKK